MNPMKSHIVTVTPLEEKTYRISCTCQGLGLRALTRDAAMRIGYSHLAVAMNDGLTNRFYEAIDKLDELC